MPSITPPTLLNGDTIAIVSPASAVDSNYIEGAAAAIQRAGFKPLILEHAAGQHGSYSGTEAERLEDLQSALDNPQVKAILCSRGGYGAVHLLPNLRLSQPKWIIGFSDISALHALCQVNGWQSIHASMAKELSLQRCENNEANNRLFEILRTGIMPDIEYPTQKGSIEGSTKGKLVGGNLAVLDGLIGTPYNIINKDTILVLEDIAEPIYKVERMLRRLRLAGILQNLRGLIIGQFTEYKPSLDYQDMYSMIAKEVADLKFPVSLGAPIGHVDNNLPFIEGAEINFTVDSHHTTIRQILSK